MWASFAHCFLLFNLWSYFSDSDLNAHRTNSFSLLLPYSLWNRGLLVHGLIDPLTCQSHFSQVGPWVFLSWSRDSPHPLSCFGCLGTWRRILVFLRTRVCCQNLAVSTSRWFGVGWCLAHFARRWDLCAPRQARVCVVQLGVLFLSSTTWPKLPPPESVW